MRWFHLLTVFACACGGSVAPHGGSDAGSGSGGDAGSGSGGGSGSGSGGGSGSGSGGGTGDDSGCPQPPSTPEYACDAAAPDAESCGPWQSMATSPRYPLGCVVTTTQEGTYCGPVTCNCTTEFADSGAMWVCPL